MNNALIKSLTGRICNIATGTFGTSFQKVRIVEVIDNWVKIENGRGQLNLVNTDYITHISVISNS